MAGYIFSLDKMESLRLYAGSGVYATKLRPPSGQWQRAHEGTFADYATMREGDNVYFFIERRIYGIGKLVNIGEECKYLNFGGAGEPRPFAYDEISPSLLWDEGPTEAPLQRFICTFEPDPYFFAQGVDMDDVLASNPSAFKMLRAFWKLSFMKFDDEENQAFRSILLKRNQSTLSNPAGSNGVFAFESAHSRLLDRLKVGSHSLDAGMASILSGCADGDRLKHEMALEAAVLYQLSAGDSQTCAVFGQWDYLSHQVVASPFKPVDYMDKMDLFGYSYIPGFRPTKAKFLVGEVKKDTASLEDVDQLLKYVDWVKDEYCFGDYSMVRAFLVAHKFPPKVVQHRNTVGVRRYTTGVRPARSLEWADVNLVRYSFKASTRRVDFFEVA